MFLGSIQAPTLHRNTSSMAGKCLSSLVADKALEGNLERPI